MAADIAVEDYAREDEHYRRALDVLREELSLGLTVQQVDRSLVPTFLFTGRELVVAVGQDGLVANVAKYVGGQPLVGVNPDPARFDGVLLPFGVEGARAHVSARYTLRYGERAEAQSSSGVLVSTGAGSSGWLSSVFTLARGLTAETGGVPGQPWRLEWEDPRLAFVVREPLRAKLVVA